MTLGFNAPLYILPFDHRGSFETKMFGWTGELTAEQTAEIAAAKRVIYDGFIAAVAAGVPKERAGILVDEQFGAAILRDAQAQGYMTACPAEKAGKTSSTLNMATTSRNISRRSRRRSAKSWCATIPTGMRRSMSGRRRGSSDSPIICIRTVAHCSCSNSWSRRNRRNLSRLQATNGGTTWSFARS